MKKYEPSDALKRILPSFFSVLTKRVKELQAEGYDVIDLGMGTHDKPTPDYIVQALKEAAELTKYHQYPPYGGFPGLKRDVAKHYEKIHDVKLNPETEITILAGSNEGLMDVSQANLNPGDLVLLPDPAYPDYVPSVLLAHGEPYFMPLLAKNHFLPDYSLIPEEILQRAKMMLLNYPNNPTSAVATPDFFAETVALADKYDIMVVHDFAYASLGFDGYKPLSFLSTPGAKDLGIETYSMSKVYNMTGWRIGFAVGNASVIENMVKVQDFLNVYPFGGIEKAAGVALTQEQEAAREIRDMYERRRDAFVSEMRAIGVDIEAPKGTFYVWIPIPEEYTSEQFATHLLNEAHVAVSPGSAFGKQGEGYIRISLVDSEQRIREAVRRFQKLDVFSKKA